MVLRNRLLLAILLIFGFQLAIAQTIEVAYPLIASYSDKDYNAHPGNYAIVQDKRGVMYFGNDRGLLEFDGVKWVLTTLPGEPAVRSLTVDKSGTLYIGADEEFGYLVPDSNSKLTYHSLSAGLKKDKQVGSIVGTFATADGVYFVSLTRLYLYTNGKLVEIELGSTLLRQPGFEINGVVYLNKANAGLAKLDKGKITILPGVEKLRDETIQFILPYGTSGLLIGTRYLGLYTYENNSLTAFKPDAEKYLSDNIISSATNSIDGNIAIGTIQGGVVVIDNKGNLQCIQRKETGLPENSVNALYMDKQQGIWIASDNDIVRIELSSPATYFKSNSGLLGNVTGITRHQGTLYVATAQGIYFLKNPDRHGADLSKGFQSNFKEVGGFRTEYHDMLSVGKSLLLATTDGLYDLHDNTPTKVLPIRANLMYRSPTNPDVVFVAVQDSIIAIQYNGKQWEKSGLIKGVNEIANSMVEVGNALWLSTPTKGILRLTFDEQKQAIIKRDFFNKGQGIPITNGKNLRVFTINNTVLVSTDNGLYKFEAASSKFVASEIFGKGFKASVLSAQTMPDGKVFIITDKDKGIATPDGKNNYTYSTDFFGKIADASYTSLYMDGNDVIWLGGSKGIIKIDATKLKKDGKGFSASLRRVQSNGRILYEGAETTIKKPIELGYSNNALRFEYASNNYDLQEYTEYQYMLEGFDKNWLPWTTETREDYTNLSEGKYIFKIRARNAYGQVSKEDTFPFVILPPWYRTWWAYGFGIIVLAGFGWYIVGARSRQLQREKQRLQELVDERTQELHQSQDRLVEQQKLASLGQLTAGIAHEIKNPLNFVNNFAELSDELLEELHEDITKNKPNITESDYKNIESLITDLRHNAQKINEHGKRADNIVKGMLMHSRQQTGEKEALDLNAMVEENVNLAYRGLRGKNALITVNFEKSFDPTIGNIMVTKQDLSRVFLNIANNAIYASYKKKEQLGESFNPVVTVTTTNLSDTTVEVRIRDNGTGISKSHIEKIFNPFFTTKPTGEGTGLGLSISYDIVVKGHGGDLKAESKEGEYTEFIIVLSKS